MDASLSRPISRYPAPTIDALPADIKERALAIQEKMGFVLNVFLVLVHRPEYSVPFLPIMIFLWRKTAASAKCFAR